MTLAGSWVNGMVRSQDDSRSKSSRSNNVYSIGKIREYIEQPLDQNVDNKIRNDISTNEGQSIQ